MITLRKQQITGIITIVATIIVSLIFASIPTETLLETVGTDNTYVFMYLVAFLGSVTTFISIPYPLFLLSLTAGGLDPVIAGLCSAGGAITADVLTFFAAKTGRALLSTRFQTAISTIAQYVERHPKVLTPGLIAYGTFSPLSNDFAVITFSLMKFRFYRIVPPLAVGNILYNLGIAFLGVYAYDWIVNII